MTIKKFTDLIAWQKSHQLVILIYKLTKTFPQDERYGLTNQMRRAAVSITSNLAEGFGRKNNKEKVQFYYICTGSISELQNQILISRDLKYLTSTQCHAAQILATESYKLVNSLIKGTKLRSKS